MKQKTIQQSISLSGVGLHTGQKVDARFLPANADEGIRFIRTDIPERPVFKIGVSVITADPNVSRCTTIHSGGHVIYTVEHLMSALAGLGIGNITIELNASEVPGMDGSAQNFVQAFRKVGVKELDAEQKVYVVKEPIAVEENGSSLLIVPAPDFRITYSLNYDNPFLKSQFLNTTVNESIFEKEIAQCRTFCMEKEIANLKERGLGKGANYDNTLVVGESGVIKNTLRFPDEFVRHKILDCIGDLYLLGMPIQGHVFAVKSGHALNRQMVKKIDQQKKRYESQGAITPGFKVEGGKEIHIQDIMKILPHRYPFLLVDRIVDMEIGKRGVGIKNVTMNDDFFRGHFPTRPIMPGVLMVEAMAQVAGIVILTNPIHHGKVAFFLSADQVKFRKTVVPGDQLVMEAEVIRDRNRTVQAKGVARVNGEIVAEAEMMFSFIEASYLNTGSN